MGKTRWAKEGLFYNGLRGGQKEGTGVGRWIMREIKKKKGKLKLEKLGIKKIIKWDLGRMVFTKKK
jgi:hypothetical protein